MWRVIIVIGIVAGYIVSIRTDSFSNKLMPFTKIYKPVVKHIYISIVTGLLFLISYLIFGFTLSLLQAQILSCLLIAVTVIDIRHRIIPNNMVIIIFILGSLFLFFHSITVSDALLGMIAGGGLLFLLALIPRAMGGGDVKLMFAMGTFLGLKGVLWALMLGFIFASIASIFLLTFKIIGRKDHIPFGPFLALGSYIAFHFIV